MELKIHKNDICIDGDYILINIQDNAFVQWKQQIEEAILQIISQQKTHSHQICDYGDILQHHSHTIDVLGMGYNSKKLAKLKSVCKKRIWQLLGNPTSDMYALLAGYFYSKIYTDIAKYFDVDKCGNIPVTELDMALEQAYRWYPSDRYVYTTIIGLKKKRDKGILAIEKCKALSTYLLIYNENDNPFRGR